jgi:AsmA protein
LPYNGFAATDLTIDQPEIVLIQTPSGNWNFSSLGAKSAASAPSAASQPSAASDKQPLNLSVKLIRITNGRLRFTRTVGHWKPLILEQVGLDIRNFSSTSKIQLALAAQVHGGGIINLNGTAGPLNSTDSAMTPLNVNLNVSQLHLAGSGMTDFAPTLAGVVTFVGNGESDGCTMRFKGRLKADKLKLSKTGAAAQRPVELVMTARHNLRRHSGVIEQGDIHIGAAVAHLTGTYAEQGESMVLNMKLAGPQMPLQDLEAMLPPAGVVLPEGASLQGGTASIDLAMQGPADRLVTTGSVALNNTTLTGFDLPQKIASIEKWAGIKANPNTQIQNLSLNATVSPEGTSAQDISLVVPAIGDLSGGGTVSPANALAFKMSAIVHTSGLLSVVGNKPIPFTVDGTSEHPVFHPDIDALAKEEVKGVEHDIGKNAGGLFKGLPGGKHR